MKLEDLRKKYYQHLQELFGNSKKINHSIVYEEIKKSFNSTVDNFHSFAKFLSEKYNINYSIFQTHLRKIIIDNGTDFTFPDAIQFLKNLNKKGETICILTYVAQKNNLNQQALKLAGSGILPYVDEVYNTTRLKYELELDYKNGIFIDDSPRDLTGLYRAGAKNLIRIKKPNNIKRTSQELTIPIEVPTYTSFDKIMI